MYGSPVWAYWLWPRGPGKPRQLKPVALRRGLGRRRARPGRRLYYSRSFMGQAWRGLAWTTC
eukprot:9965055-Lingulodinium_polyedra.AAC.1